MAIVSVNVFPWSMMVDINSNGACLTDLMLLRLIKIERILSSTLSAYKYGLEKVAGEHELDLS